MSRPSAGNGGVGLGYNVQFEWLIFYQDKYQSRYGWHHQRNVLTVFSAPNYCYRCPLKTKSNQTTFTGAATRLPWSSLTLSSSLHFSSLTRHQGSKRCMYRATCLIIFYESSDKHLNIVNCHSFMAGHPDCHDLRFSIVRTCNMFKGYHK